MTDKTLDASQVRLWLEGQKEADRRSRRERVRWLLSLTPEQALALYLALWETCGRARDTEDVEGILVRQRLRVDTDYIRSWLQAFRDVVVGHDPLDLFEQALQRTQRRLEESHAGA